MAKYEGELRGDFDEILQTIDRAVMKGSISASNEDSSDFCSDGARCAVRVYERYSMFGGNRVSLSVTLAGMGGRIFVSAITSGGSQAVFFKVNTLGESSFLDTVTDAIEVFRA